MKSNRILIVFLMLFTLLIAVGCDDEDKAADEEALRIRKLAEMRESISGYLLLASIVVVLGGLFLAPIMEKFRAKTASWIGMTLDTQILVAKVTYFAVVILILTFSFQNESLKPLFPAVLVLVAGTFYPFFVHYIPGLKNADAMRRKAAMSQIKGFILMIVVVYVLISVLTPDGIFGIVLK